MDHRGGDIFCLWYIIFGDGILYFILYIIFYYIYYILFYFILYYFILFYMGNNPKSFLENFLLRAFFCKKNKI